MMFGLETQVSENSLNQYAVLFCFPKVSKHLSNLLKHLPALFITEWLNMKIQIKKNRLEYKMAIFAKVYQYYFFSFKFKTTHCEKFILQNIRHPCHSFARDL